MFSHENASDTLSAENTDIQIIQKRNVNIHQRPTTLSIALHDAISIWVDLMRNVTDKLHNFKFYTRDQTFKKKWKLRNYLLDKLVNLG